MEESVIQQETKAAEVPSNNNQEKTKPVPSDNTQTLTIGLRSKNKISPSRLPSKKRKSSHDSSQQSVMSNTSDVKNHKENEQKYTPKTEHNADTETQNNGDKKKDASNKSETSIASSPDRRTRKNSADSSLWIGGIRKDSSDVISSPGSQQQKHKQLARLRLGSGSLSSRDSPARVRLRSGSQDSLSGIPKLPKLPSGSHTSTDSVARRPRSGSTTSLDDPFFRRKLSTDSDGLVSSRRMSQDSSVKLDVLMDLPPPEPINLNPKIGELEVNVARPRSNSTASLVNEGLSTVGGGALEHLNALADDAKPAAKKRRDSTEADDNSSAAETFASSGHRVLMEAIKLATGNGETSSKEGSQDTNRRARLESWSGGGRERFESLGSVLEANAFAGRGRDRLESWGGMSDLSINFNASAGGGSSTERGVSSAAAAAAAAATAVAEQFELAGGVDDIAGLGLFEEGNRQRTSSIPSRIALGRDRFNSIASFSEASFLPEGAEVTIDLNSIMQAAMAHVGDLAELAGIVENVAGVGEGREADGSEGSSVASPLIGATVEGPGGQRPRSSSISSKLPVDYEALAAAVDAAQAATGNIDIDTLGLGRGEESSSTEGRPRKENGRRWRRQLPLKRDRTTSETSEEERASGAAVSEKEMDRIRKRARMVACGKSPAKKTPGSSRRKQTVPIKKRAKRQNPSPLQPDAPESSDSPAQTPRASNKAIAAADFMPDVPLSSLEKGAAKGQASQKWDSMFEALLGYIEERRQEETVDFSEEERNEWSWDGNVPTTHKTSDGKALGRWVNNQRSAKSKGTLKADREDRLLQAGLKWSVMASNSWNETLDELRNYINEHTKDGKEWDGNVPTHYQIKAKPNGKFAGEDKNLGRWVNRQRSLYQAGRLRKDRQIALEKLGLKWSMLSSTSWDAMFETLLEYVTERKSKEGSWDGNVPANFRTTDNPPRALGRWINRQRSAYTKRKLKKEYVDKLNSIGLKWSVHEKNLGLRSTPVDDAIGNNAEGEKPQVKAEPVADNIVSSSGEGSKKESEVPDKASSSTETVDEKASSTLSETNPTVLMV